MDAPLYLSYSSAFLIGLLGSTHCLGMCGGISASLSMALPVGRGFRLRQSLMLLCFNFGRIGSYVLLATLVALLSTSAADHSAHLGPLFRVLAGVLLVIMGLSMAQWWQGIRRVEKLGAPVWRRLSPLAQTFMPVRHPGQALGLGALWGWLPCGLIYSTLGYAALQPSIASAALTMLCFGLGTLPSMLATGFAAGWIKQLRQDRYFRQGAGLMLIVFGIWTAASPLIMMTMKMAH